MERLPAEIVFQIAGFIEPKDVVCLMLVSRRLLKLATDDNLWKKICFEHSRAEGMRRRQLLFAQADRRLLDLVRAVDNVSAEGSTPHSINAPDAAALQAYRAANRNKTQILASWDPSYPDEKINFYQEYIHRHASISLSWFQNAHDGRRVNKVHQEAVGIGALYNTSGSAVEKVYAPMDDGSICVWEASHDAINSDSNRQGQLLHKSPVGLLSERGPNLDMNTRIAQSKAIMTETGAVEVVSIDSRAEKGFFAVQNVLNFVDLRTLQVISRTPYPFSITALSQANHPTPTTVATNWTLHLHDSRKPASYRTEGSSTKCELIAGKDPKSDFDQLNTGDSKFICANFPQPGPLSVLHQTHDGEWDGNGEIWVAGRFTSLLNYDRRVFPRLRGIVFSGARLSCITSIPHPFIPLHNCLNRIALDPAVVRENKALPGSTLIAAGEYKGKGSLELYGLSPDPTRSVVSSDSLTKRNHHAFYHNRQTASSSKLLSVAPHGGRLVFSDGDGNLKWVERDGFTPVRHFNINSPTADSPNAQTLNPGEEDIVQKIIPTIANSTLASHSIPLNRDNLLIWTGDGRLGMVGFGSKPIFEHDDLGDMVQSAVEAEMMRKEREYDAELRRALETQAAELRWVRGLGMRSF